MLNKTTIEELQQILKKDGNDLDMEKVTDIANSLVGYFDLLAEIYNKENE